MMHFTTVDHDSFTLENGRLSGFTDLGTGMVSVRVLVPVCPGRCPKFYLVAAGMIVMLAKVTSVDHDRVTDEARAEAAAKADIATFEATGGWDDGYDEPDYADAEIRGL